MQPSDKEAATAITVAWLEALGKDGLVSLANSVGVTTGQRTNSGALHGQIVAGFFTTVLNAVTNAPQYRTSP